MKRELVVTVDCGRRLCKGCGQFRANGCELFGVWLQADEKHRPLRCDDCILAEGAAVLGVITSMSFDGAEVTP